MSTERDTTADVTAQAEALAAETAAAGDNMTGDVVSIVADGLTEHGLDVRSPQWDGCHILKITNAAGVLCEVAIYDSGSAVWEHRLRDGSQVDPVQVTGIAMELLGLDLTESRTAFLRKYPSLTLKGLAGRALAECGMEVNLEIYRDDFFFDVYSEIEVTNPSQPSRGTLRLADDNSLRWECRLNGPVVDAPGIDPQVFVGAIVKALVG